MKKQNFIKGSAILIVSVLIVKVLGAMFKIPLTNLIGGTGMGYFSGAYGLFLPVYAVFVTGLSSAASKLTAENFIIEGYSGAVKIKKYSLLTFSFIGILGTAVIVFLAYPFSVYVLGNKNVYLSILLIAPSVMFGCISAAYRGYYEGLRNMYPTALSQLAEAVVKLIAGLWFCHLVMVNADTITKYINIDPTALAAAGAVAGVTASSFTGMMYIIVSDLFLSRKYMSGVYKEKKIKNANSAFIKEIIITILPIAIGALLSNLTSLADLATIMKISDMSYKSNEIYYTSRYDFIGQIGKEEFAAFAYGSFNGLAVTVFNLVPSITNIFGKSILPHMTAAWTRKDMKALSEHASEVLKIAMLVSVPAGLGMCVMAKEILTALFPGSSDEIMFSQLSLTVLAPAVILLSASYPVFSMLQAIGRADIPAKIMIPAILIKLAGNVFLVSIPSLNITGAAISTDICYAFIFVFSLVKLVKLCKIKINIKSVFLNPVYAGLMCMMSAFICRNILSGYVSNNIELAASVAAGAAAYAVSLWLLGDTYIICMFKKKK